MKHIVTGKRAFGQKSFAPSLRPLSTHLAPFSRPLIPYRGEIRTRSQPRKQNDADSSKQPADTPNSENWNFFSELSKSLAKKMIDDVWTQGEVGVLNDLLAPGHVYTDSCWQHTILKGRSGLSNFVQDLRVAFPDLKYSVKETMHRLGPGAGDATVMVYWTCEGTQTGDFLGLPPSGQREAFNGVHVLKVDLATGKLTATEVYRECAVAEQKYKMSVGWLDGSVDA